ncbi:hypothetical protein ACLOJK_011459 [Asimina triloba]
MSTEAATTSSQFTYSAPSYFPLPFHLQKSDPTAQQAPDPQQFVAQQYPPKPYMPPPPIPPAVKLPQAPVFPSVYPAPAPVPGVYSLPQYQQAQQLFQRDAQTITPEALESVKAALASSEIEHKAETKKKAIPRKAAGQSWEDPTLADWPENDYRLFCGDLGNEVNDEVLSKAFSRFPAFNMAKVSFHDPCLSFVSLSKDIKVVRDKRTGKTRGYGFVSFSNPSDIAAALKEMNVCINVVVANKMKQEKYNYMLVQRGNIFPTNTTQLLQDFERCLQSSLRGYKLSLKTKEEVPPPKIKTMLKLDFGSLGWGSNTVMQAFFSNMCLYYTIPKLTSADMDDYLLV